MKTKAERMPEWKKTKEKKTEGRNETKKCRKQFVTGFSTPCQLLSGRKEMKEGMEKEKGARKERIISGYLYVINSNITAVPEHRKCIVNNVNNKHSYKILCTSDAMALSSNFCLKKKKKKKSERKRNRQTFDL